MTKIKKTKDMCGTSRNFKGWWCSIEKGHGGTSCALRPCWWNLYDRWIYRGML